MVILELYIHIKVEKVKKIFRHGFPEILLMLGFAVSCFIIIYGVNVLFNVKKEDLNINRYENRLEESYDPSVLEDKKIDYKTEVELMLKAAQNIASGNITFVSKLYINNRVDWFETYIIIKANEATKLSVSEKISDNKGIYIGESLKKYLGEFSEQDELLLNDRIYKVSGILENNMASEVDNSIYIVWDECDKSSRQLAKESIVDYLQDGLINVIYESDSDIDDSFEKLTNNFEKINLYDMGSNTLYSGNYQNYWYKYYNYIFVGTSLVFSIINCMCVSILWLKRRKHEMAIRIAFGYRKSQLYTLFLKDAIFVCILSYLVALFFVVLMSFVLGINSIFQNLWMKISLSLVMMIILLIVLVSISINKFMKRNVIEIK